MNDWVLNPARRSDAPAFFTDAQLAAVRGFYQDAERTPLRTLPGLARSIGLSSVMVKDESARFGLPAFKIAGARYAIARLVESNRTAMTDLACATAGNHGRAVARVARERGLRAHVFVPAGTAAASIDALRNDGADVTVTDVAYDETVARMAWEADQRGWTIVSDVSWVGYDDIPRAIMAGYTWILEEAARQWGDRRPDLVVVQAGVGSLAGAAAGWLVSRYGADRPRLVIAEPKGSACVLESLRAGRRVVLESCAPTKMVGLRCAAVSAAAWPVIHAVADAAIAVSEDLAEHSRARLAAPGAGDPVIAAGASGACGVAALTRLALDPVLEPLRAALGVGSTSRVMAIVTEGHT
jgi:diaminopropionate ammonia-lyase